MMVRTIGGIFLLVTAISIPHRAVGQVKARALSAGSASVVSSGQRFGIRVMVGEPVSGLTKGDVYKIGSGFWYADPEAKVPEAIEAELDLPGEIPTEFELHQNYPNPFNPVTSILISIPYRSNARLEVYNMMGQLVSVLIDTDLAAGTHRIQWDAVDMTGRSVSSGMYVYRLIAGEVSKTRTMILLK